MVSSQPIIRAIGLNKIYTKGSSLIKAVDNISLTIAKGTVTCITGPSGSGKSTLLSMIGLLTYPDNGKIFFHGKDMTRLSEIALTKFRKKKFGFIFQNGYLFSHLTTVENVTLPLLNTDISLKQARSRAKEILKNLGLEDRINFFVKELSGGEAQRVNIARALITDPEILLADEPSSNIDTKLTAEFLQLIFDLRRERNLTVIMASHDPQIIDEAEVQIKLRDGKIISSM